MRPPQSYGVTGSRSVRAGSRQCGKSHQDPEKPDVVILGGCFVILGGCIVILGGCIVILGLDPRIPLRPYSPPSSHSSSVRAIGDARGRPEHDVESEHDLASEHEGARVANCQNDTARALTGEVPTGLLRAMRPRLRGLLTARIAQGAPSARSM